MAGKKSVWAGVSFVLSLLLTTGIMTVFSACGQKEDGSWMHCHQPQMAVAICGIGMMVVFALSWVFKGKAVRIVLLTAGLALSAAAFLIPGTIMPMCMMRTMRCYTVMQPFTRVMTVLIAGGCFLQLFDVLKGKAGR